MTWLATAQKPGRKVYWAVRGQFTNAAGSTSSVAWGTQYVRTSSGMLEGRLLQAPSPWSYGVPQVVGAAPERSSSSIVLDNTDGSLNDALLGMTAGSSATLQFGSYGFLNLTVRIYAGVIDPATGTGYELACSPTLCCAGAVQSSNGRIMVPLAARDQDIYGHSPYLVTVRQARNSATGGLADGSYYTRGGSSGTLTQSDATNLLGRWNTAQDEYLPFAYGRPLLPLRLVTDTGVNGNLILAAFVSVEEPTISDFASWRLRTDSDSAVSLFDERASRLSGHSNQQTLYKIRRRFTLADGSTTKDLWIVFMSAGLRRWRDSEAEELKSHEHFAIPPSSNYVGMGAGYTSSPASIIRQLVADHSDGGAAKVHAGSVSRTNRAIAHRGRFGGLLRSDVSIAEPISQIAAAAGISLWHSHLDDTLHMQPALGYNADDVSAAASASIPHIKASDIAEGSFRVILPRSPGEHGAGVNLVTAVWPPELKEFWGGDLLTRSPGKGSLPLGPRVETQIPGGWLYGPDAETVLQDTAATRYRQGVLFQCVVPTWVLNYECLTLMRLSHPFGPGDGGTAGDAYRLVRLLRVDEVMPDDDACRVTFEDLGPYDGLKPVKLDAVANWLRHNSAGSTKALTLTNASTTVTASGGDPFGTAEVGDHLWTFGAANVANRRSWRITAITDPNEVEIEFAPTVTETINASAGGTAVIDSAYVVMKTQGSADTGSSFRSDYLRLCQETGANAGKFRDNATAGMDLLNG